jgi:PPK2 family polyphosphate:nucleotide phosphotransferase
MAGTRRSRTAVRVGELLRYDGASEGRQATDPRATPGAPGGRSATEADFASTAPRLAELQERLYAEGVGGGRRALLLVLQGMDTSGKDGTTKHVAGQVNPLGLRITSFKAPTAAERRHDFLWRVRRAVPGSGYVGIFNRSQYEDVLVVRVHSLVAEPVWQKRYAEINRFEEEAAASGTAILKCFLHLSYDEQRSRLLARLDDPTKHWKFKEGDIDERHLWPKYQAAYSDAVERCSTDPAPWYVVPSDRKWYRNWAIGSMLVETLAEMDLHYPDPGLEIDRLRERLAPPN